MLYLLISNISTTKGMRSSNSPAQYLWWLNISYIILCYGLSLRKLVRIAFTQRINCSTPKPSIHTFWYFLPSWKKSVRCRGILSNTKYELWCTQIYKMGAEQGKRFPPYRVLVDFSYFRILIHGAAQIMLAVSRKKKFLWKTCLSYLDAQF